MDPITVLGITGHPRTSFPDVGLTDAAKRARTLSCGLSSPIAVCYSVYRSRSALRHSVSRVGFSSIIWSHLAGS